jgi:hypothetical protein
MQMNDVNEDVNEEPTVQVDNDNSEKKMLELMAQMQAQATNIPDNTVENKSDSIGITVKPEEDDTNYWEIDDIPTKYKLYPDGTQIMARPLKVIEIKKLTSITDENADKVVNDILRKSIRGIDVNDIYSVDKMYLLLWLRANSFRDNRYVVGFDCELCSKETSYHFDINNVDVDYLSDDYNPTEILTLSNSDEIKVKLLQIKDELALSSFDMKYRSVFEKSGEKVDDELLAISFMIDTINGIKLDAIKLYNYLLDMNPGDFALLTTKLSDNNVGIKSYMNVTCTECGGESQVGLTFHPDFFLPNYRPERDPRD